MTLIDRHPGHDARTKMRAKFTRFHPSLRAQLFANQLNAAITNNWPQRAFIAVQP